MYMIMIKETYTFPSRFSLDEYCYILNIASSTYELCEPDTQFNLSTPLISHLYNGHRDGTLS